MRSVKKKYHKLGIMRNRNVFLIALEAGSPKYWCWEGCFLLRAAREILLVAISSACK